MNNIGNEKAFIIVDDDAGHALLIRKTLKRIGIVNSVFHCFNAYELLDLLNGKKAGSASFSPNSFIVFLDISMPGLSGIDVLEIIRLDEKLKDITVVMVSTSESPEEMNKCFEFGCLDFLVKPVSQAQLKECCERIASGNGVN
ncbi:MAG: response regulator [Bacteroidales bacterium]|nr:response regulator [Bacteroidales bacterium]